MHAYTPIALGIALALSAGVATAAGASPSSAQIPSSSAIPAMPLKQALNEFAQREHLQLVYVSEVADGMRSSGSRGGLSQRATLSALLRGTGLQFKYINANTVTISHAADPAAPDPQPSDPPPKATPAPKPETLQAIQVTGSHIRRAELETSNPLVTISSAQIQQTGKLTLGQVVQDLPVITGGITNPRVDDQGGNGGTFVGLRGLGSNRTLVLVNGQRVINDDLNTIPAALVDRIEVLTDGASAVYGSDAIGGVINIILKSHYQGAQFSTNYGISDRDDGARRGVSFMFGQTSDKGSILGGIDYNKFDQVGSPARKFSDGALSIYGGTNTLPYSYIGGSTYAARDRISLPKSMAGLYGCSNLSLNQGALGASPTSLSDYHCYSNQGDAYDFTSSTLLMTPQERTSAFLNGTYHLADNIDAYLTVYHNKTTADKQEAPSLFGTGQGVVISQYSMYNPFGINFGGKKGAAYRSRLVAAGNRVFRFATSTDQIELGLRGHTSLFGNDWTWDVGYDYGHMSDVSTLLGLVDVTALNAGLGPSMLDPASGQPICVKTPGDPTSVISGCTPWDPFNLFSPSAVAALQASASPALVNSYQIERIKHVDVSGGLFNLPAGAAQLAAGVSRRDEYTNARVDPVLLLDPDTGACVLSSGCTSPLQGGYNVKEAYAELFIPILSGLPLAHGLNVTLGDRWSKYSTFGSTNNWKAAIEYRPIEDLLLRGTVSSVFRAPTIGNVFGAPAASFPSISQDPCDHITVANPACVGVPLDGSFVDFLDHQQLKGISSGSAYAGFPLGPETGKSFDFGAVYSPRFAPGFSVSVDVWRIYLNNVITSIGAQNILNLCFNGVSKYCSLIQRSGPGSSEPGQIANILQPVGNLGRIDTNGVDLSTQYKLPSFAFGQFTVGLNTTYMSKFDIQTAPGLSANQDLHGAGVMGTAGSPLAGACPSPGGDICFFPRVRAQGFLSWQLGPWDAQWRMRYISKFDIGSRDPSQGFSAVPGFKADNPYVLHYGSTTYSDFTLGYTIKPINTRLDIGVDNVFDKQPPLVFANNTVNANTDPSDFDTLGRYYWGRLTVNF